MKSKKRQNGGKIKPNMTAIIICVAVFTINLEDKSRLSSIYPHSSSSPLDIWVIDFSITKIISYTYSLNMTPPGINNIQNSDSHQNQDSHIHQNPTQDLNQYSQYIDNLCIFSQFCSLTSFDEYIDFMNKLEQ